jgi:hypothetical protein
VQVSILENLDEQIEQLKFDYESSNAIENPKLEAPV